MKMKTLNLSDDDELGWIVHALRNNARADRVRVKELEDGPQSALIKSLSGVFVTQAERQEKLAERIETFRSSE